MRIKTNRLKISPFSKENIDDLYEIYSNKETCRYLLHEAWNEKTKDSEFSKKLKEQVLTIDTPLSLACSLYGKVIGDISVWYTEMKDTVEIGFVFNQNYSGCGYATEALKSVVDYLFKIEKIHRIQANLDARNLASASLCQRIGMRQEAHFIQDYWNKGEWTDSFVYGMLKKDLLK